MPRARNFWPLLVLLVGAVAGASTASAQPAGSTAGNDGLERIDGPFQDFFWRPGATLSQYKRVVLLDPYVEFVDDWLKEKNRGKRSSNKVDEEKADAIKAALASDVLTIFRDTLTDGGYEIVNVAAPDVLILRPAMLNVDIGLDVYVQNRFQDNAAFTKMMLYLEFFDSTSSTLIGRAAEVQAEEGSTRPIVRHILTPWAERLRDLLREGVE